MKENHEWINDGNVSWTKDYDLSKFCGREFQWDRDLEREMRLERKRERESKRERKEERKGEK